MPLGSILGGLASAVAGPLIGGLLGGKADEQQQVVTQQQQAQPWAALQPYLAAQGPIPPYLQGTPDLYMPWLQWAQGSGEGTNLMPPPPMLIDYVRAREGIGTPTGEPATPGDRVPSMPGEPPTRQEKEPSPAAPIAPMLPNFRSLGGMVDDTPYVGFGGTDISGARSIDEMVQRHQAQLAEFNKLRGFLRP